MKNMDAMITLSCAWGQGGRRDVIVVFFPDEEAGMVHGSRWFVDNRPDLFAAHLRHTRSVASRCPSRRSSALPDTDSGKGH